MTTLERLAATEALLLHYMTECEHRGRQVTELQGRCTEQLVELRRHRGVEKVIENTYTKAVKQYVEATSGAYGPPAPADSTSAKALDLAQRKLAAVLALVAGRGGALSLEIAAICESSSTEAQGPSPAERRLAINQGDVTDDTRFVRFSDLREFYDQILGAVAECAESNGLRGLAQELVRKA